MELIEHLKERFNFTDGQIKESGISLVKTGFEVLDFNTSIDIISAEIYLLSKDNNVDVDTLMNKIKSVVVETAEIMEKGVEIL